MAYQSCPSADLVVVQISKASLALVAAKDAPETKHVLDMTDAVERFARRQRMSQECIDYAHDLKMQALAKMGRLLKEAPKNEGTRGQLRGSMAESGGSVLELPENTAPTLADLGIDKKTSSLSKRGQRDSFSRAAQCRKNVGEEWIVIVVAPPSSRDQDNSLGIRTWHTKRFLHPPRWHRLVIVTQRLLRANRATHLGSN